MIEHDIKRKLTTIMVADIVNFSRLTANNEDWTIRAFSEFREVVDKIIACHNGRIFNTGGDSVLAEFNSPVEAVRCAIDFQEAARSRNLLQPAERQLRFRIGINLGDVMVRGSDLLGDAVNIAARLETIAEPGGICVSGAVWEQVRDKLSIGCVDLGEQTIKNLPRPVRVYRLRLESDEGPGGLMRHEKTSSSPRDRPAPRSTKILISGIALAALLIGGIIAWRSWLNNAAPSPARDAGSHSAVNGIGGTSTTLERLEALEEEAKRNPMERARIVETLKNVLQETARADRKKRAMVIAILKRLTNGKMRALFASELEGADLVDVDFSAADLYHVNLKGAFLILSNFENANLTEADLSRTLLRGVRFTGTILNNANLASADWFNAFGITLSQLERVRHEGMVSCPAGSGSQSFIDWINQNYGIKYEQYTPAHRAALQEAWASYSRPGGLCDYINQTSRQQ